ncbi:MAG: DUF455 family protein [Bacteriovoracaceae bacterium]
MSRSYFDLCRTILEGGSLSDKLTDLSAIEFTDWIDYQIPALPGRETKLLMSEKRTKFPKHFHLPESRAKALHFFANHELLAIEMMAAAILFFPHKTEEDIKFKKGITQTLREEQKHFKLYQARMKDFGLNFGDVPLNNFFWRQMHSLKTPEEYLAMMAMTFEMANLDFMLFYKEAFSNVEDHKTTQILDIVLEDEISHVAFGVNYLKKKREDRDLWDYYQSLLPPPLTPARSKGLVLNKKSRLETGIDQAFLDKAINYVDHYSVTQRREWREQS